MNHAECDYLSLSRVQTLGGISSVSPSTVSVPAQVCVLPSFGDRACKSILRRFPSPVLPVPSSIQTPSFFLNRMDSLNIPFDMVKKVLIRFA